MGQCFSSNVVSLCIQFSALTPMTHGAVYNVYSSANGYNCANATSNDMCILHCNEEKANSLSFDCGNAGNCQLLCEQSLCMGNGFLNATNVANDLSVISTAMRCLESAIVTAPNYGNAIFNQTSERSFRDMTVNAGTNTQNIIIDCTVGLGDECRNTNVNAQTAQFLKITVGASSEYQGVTNKAQIICPHNSAYNGAEIAPCILDLSGGGLLDYVDIITENGIPADVWIKTDGSSVLTDVTIICNAGTSLNSGNTFLPSSQCWNQGTTLNPTTSNPTTATPHTIITGQWNDDYTISQSTGWIVRNDTNDLINSVFTGNIDTYHGPYYENIKLIRYFACSYQASLNIEYYFGYSCTEANDHTSLYLNDILKHTAEGTTNEGENFADQSLESEVLSKANCADAWKRKLINGTMNQISANVVFKVQIDIVLSTSSEAAIITQTKIHCNPITSEPTTSIPSTSIPTTSIPTTTYPTTKSPTTSAPTTSAPTTSTPTAALPTTQIPTTSIPTTSVPTTSTPTISPKPTAQPSVHPSYGPSQIPTISPTKGPSTQPTPSPVKPTRKPTLSCKHCGGVGGSTNGNCIIKMLTAILFVCFCVVFVL